MGQHGAWICGSGEKYKRNRVRPFWDALCMMSFLEEGLDALSISSRGFGGIPGGVFNAVLGYCGLSTVAKLRLVNRATKRAVETSGRVRTKLVCEEDSEAVQWRFDEPGRKRAGQFFWQGKSEDSFWLQFLVGVEWGRATLHEGSDIASRFFRQMGILQHVALIEEALDLVETVRPSGLRRFNVDWPIAVGWPGLMDFVERVNASTLHYTVRCVFRGDIPADKNPRMVLGHKFKDVVFRGWTDLPRLRQCVQFARTTEVDSVVFVDVHAVRLADLAAMVAPCRLVRRLELSDGCVDLEGRQPDVLLSPAVHHLLVSRTHFHNDRPGRYGSCPVGELTVSDAPHFTACYSFPNVGKLALLSDECHRPLACDSLIKRVRALRLMAPPSRLPAKDVFARSSIVRLEILLHVTKVSRDGHPRVLAPVKGIKTLEELTLVLLTWKPPSTRTLKNGHEYRALLNAFGRNLANSNNRLRAFNVGILHRNSENTDLSFNACQQTLCLNSQQLKAL